MCLREDTVNNILKLCDEELEASTLKTVAGTEIHHNLNFEDHINPFWSYVAILYPLKTAENHRFSNVFRGYRNVTLDLNGLKYFAVKRLKH